MASKGYIPSELEFKEALIRLADKHSFGKFAPGKDLWNEKKPNGWATAAKLSIVYRAGKGEPPDWRVTVEMISGLPLARRGELQRWKSAMIDAPPVEPFDNHLYADGLPSERRTPSEPFPPFDEHLYADGLPVCRTYETDDHIVYVLR